MLRPFAPRSDVDPIQLSRPEEDKRWRLTVTESPSNRPHDKAPPVPSAEQEPAEQESAEQESAEQESAEQDPAVQGAERPPNKSAKTALTKFNSLGQRVTDWIKKQKEATASNPQRFAPLFHLGTFTLSALTFSFGLYRFDEAQKHNIEVMAEITKQLQQDDNIAKLQSELVLIQNQTAQATKELAQTQEKANLWQHKYQEFRLTVDRQTLEQQRLLNRSKGKIVHATDRMAKALEIRNEATGAGIAELEVYAPAQLAPREYELISVRIKNVSTNQFHGKIRARVPASLRNGCIGRNSSLYWECLAVVPEKFILEPGQEEIVFFDLWMVRCGSFNADLYLFIDPPEGKREPYRSYRIHYTREKDSAGCALKRPQTQDEDD